MTWNHQLRGRWQRRQEKPEGREGKVYLLPALQILDQFYSTKPTLITAVPTKHSPTTWESLPFCFNHQGQSLGPPPV